VNRIGFATSARYRDLAPSDIVVAKLLRQRGRQVEPIVWTETAPSEIKCDIVVIRSVWDYHLNAARFLAWVAAVADRAQVFNSPEIIRWNSDKRYLFDLEAAGLAVPRMEVLEQQSTVDVSRALHKHEFGKAVIKPVVSASAFETYVADAENALNLQPRINQVLQSRTMLMQEFVSEILTEGEWSLMYFGGEYSHAVRKLAKAGDFRVQSDFGGSHRLETPGMSVRKVAQQVVDRFGAETLYARIDIVEATRSPLIMEVELIDPELFLTVEPSGAERFANALDRIAVRSPKN